MPRKKENLICRRFGRLTVVDFSHMDSHGESYWLCECDCGNSVTAARSNLMRGHTTSCGCRKHEREKGDLTGRRFGRLTVIAYDHSDANYVTHWICKCECGKTKVVSRGNLINGSTVSCGCYSSEQLSDRATTHGMSKTRLYTIWRGMHQRCTNPHSDSFERYGDRGISVCEEWDEFENFRDWALCNGYESALSIDREDNDGDYTPENCRWADAYTQHNNKSNNRIITYAGESDTVANWARRFGLRYSVLSSRIRRGNMDDFEKYFSKIDRG